MEYSKGVTKVAEFIFELLSEALGLSTDHLKQMGCANGLMILGQCYPPCSDPDRTLGATQHIDRPFINILLPDHIEGLQVLHDGYWIDDPEALILNVVDLLQLFSTFENRKVYSIM